MRFDKETRAQIHGAKAGEAVTIKWPTGATQPEKDRTYRVQALEDVQRAKDRLEEHPETCRDAMAQMHKRQYGKFPDGYKPPKTKLPRPSRSDPCILVLDVEVLEIGKGYEAKVILWEEGDPVRHTGIKATLPGGPDRIDKHNELPEPTEYEPEEIPGRPSRSEREDEDESLRLEHDASAEAIDIDKAQKKVAAERAKGKPGKLAAQALERARRRAETIAEAA